MTLINSLKTVLILLFLLMALPSWGASSSSCDSMYGDTVEMCHRVDLAIRAKEAGVDCIDCFMQQAPEPNALAEVLGVVEHNGDNLFPFSDSIVFCDGNLLMG